MIVAAFVLAASITWSGFASASDVQIAAAIIDTLGNKVDVGVSIGGGTRDGVGVGIGVGRDGVDVDVNISPRSLTQPPATPPDKPRPVPEDPAEDLLNLGRDAILQGVNQLGRQDRDRLKVNCRVVVARPESFSPALVSLCWIVLEPVQGGGG